MDAEKGRTTMVDLAHAGGSTFIASGVAPWNIEPLMRELIAAVRQVSLTVNVPQIGVPDVHVDVAAPRVEMTVPPQLTPVNVQPAAPQIVVVTSNRFLLASLCVMAAADIALKIMGYLHAAH